jgi:hypothetical protein
MTTKKVKKSNAVFDYRTIKTVDDAFKKCGYDPKTLPEVSMLPEKQRAQIITYYLLAIIFEAINDGWEPDFSNLNEARYFPWPWVLSSGFGFSDSDYLYGLASARVGSRLCTNSSEKAIYILEQFPDLWKNWLLNVNLK